MDKEVEELKKEAFEMGKYYYKGFTASVQWIIHTSKIYLDDTLEQSDIDECYEWLGLLVDHYNKIPYDRLHGREQYYSLFLVNQLLNKFQNTLNQFFDNKSYSLYEALSNYGTTMTGVTEFYADYFKKLLDKIRSYPGEEEFKINIFDHQNQVWNL